MRKYLKRSWLLALTCNVTMLTLNIPTMTELGVLTVTFYLLFELYRVAHGIQFPDQGSNPCPSQGAWSLSQ